MAKNYKGKEWSPRGEPIPAYSRTNLPPQDVDLVVCEIPGELRVSFAWIGEGLSEEFDPDDPNDIAVLRFTADDLRRPPDEFEHESRSYQDNSFATALPAWTPLPILRSVCEALMRRLEGESHWKRILEEWSWIGGDEARRIHAARKGAQ